MFYGIIGITTLRKPHLLFDINNNTNVSYNLLFETLSASSKITGNLQEH